MTKNAFNAEIRRLCLQEGAPELSGVLSGLYGNPHLRSEKSREAFLKSAERVILYGGDNGDRRKSILRKLLPVAALLAAGGGLLAAGDAWGRHARDTGRTEGPFKGIPRWLFEKATGTKVDWIGRSNMIPNDEYHRRVLSADEYDNLMHHGRYGD